MKLSDINFDIVYDTNIDSDVLNQFYIPALSSAVEYRRIAGFFSSTAFSVAAEGIESLILNNGKMKLLASPNFSTDDIDVINRVYDDETSVGEILIDNLLGSIDADFIENEHAEALGWMLAHNFLEIRIVIVNEENKITSNDIFHQKIGIIEDGENTLVFSGSINESATGWLGNVEEFDVFCSWRNENERIERKISNFETYWSVGTTKRSQTLELPDVVRKKWIEKIPDNYEDLKIFKNIKNKPIKIRPYQKDAIQCWFDNNCRGIFNMATGTGKTITSIFAIKRLLDQEKGKITLVVAVPLQHLIEDPWIKTISEILLKDEFNFSIVRAFNSSKKWIPEAEDALQNLRFGIINRLIIVTTYDTYSSEKFINIIKKLKGKKILLADEVHNSGSGTYKEGLLDEYDFRLGLSATPARYLDDYGTKIIQNYFEKEVYSFSLERAINEINPDTRQTYLCPYRYIPLFVNLNSEEINAYKEYSYKMAKFSNIEHLTPSQEKQYTMILIQRSRIIKNAASKLEKLNEIIPELESQGFMDRCLIYCSDGKDPEEHEKTLTKVISCLNKNKISNRRFTSEEKISERQEILKDFSNLDIRTLVAIKCLDEGVDVPATKNAIIMASTGNPREYIQRRGRVLRRSPGKEFATIFDFIVIPGDKILDWDAETQILSNELERFKEFSQYSMNKEENEEIENKLREKYGIQVIT